jgi:hypothetical protein
LFNNALSTAAINSVRELLFKQNVKKGGLIIGSTPVSGRNGGKSEEISGRIPSVPVRIRNGISLMKFQWATA